MSLKILTNEQDKYLRSIALGRSVQSCTDDLNKRFGTSFSIGQIRAYKSNHQIKSGMNPWEFVDHKKMRKLSDEQDQWLRNNAKGKYNDELTLMFNDMFKTAFTIKQIDSYKTNHGISSGLTGHFPKGHIPLNKGKKFPGHTNSTSFKKGNVPPNRVPIGTERTEKDGYIQVKVQDGKLNKNWKLKHVKIWEDKNGPLPKGYIVIFLDGDNRNFDLDNLLAITKATNVRLNQNHLRHRNKEITEAGVAFAELITSISTAKRRIEEE